LHTPRLAEIALAHADDEFRRLGRAGLRWCGGLTAGNHDEAEREAEERFHQSTME
jgi:hypothetical protein